MKFLIIPNPYKNSVENYINDVSEKLRNFGAVPVVGSEFYMQFGGCGADPFDMENDDFSALSAVIVLGGDGTIIRGAKIAAEKDLPVLGVNFGRLGFMAGLEDVSFDGIKRLVDGNFSVENRMMLNVKIEDDPISYTVLNDAVISRGAFAHNRP